MINEWNEVESKRAERTWGHKLPQYTQDMFNFALSKGNTFLDLGCGFGRFLNFLTKDREDPAWIGYDSSEAMIALIKERFPEYLLRVFCKNVTDLITHSTDVILSSAVFIHIPVDDQNKILSNISKLAPKPKAITFDINCPAEAQIDRLKNKQTDHFERFITVTKGSDVKFRMTWQSHYEVTKQVLKLFPDYNLTTKFYDLKHKRHKVVYLLEK